jgi:hypothetical protein
MTSVNDLKGFIGMTGILVCEGLNFRVLILDVKTAYGQSRFLIAPKDGTGQKWASASRVRFEPEALESGGK